MVGCSSENIAGVQVWRACSFSLLPLSTPLGWLLQVASVEQGLVLRVSLRLGMARAASLGTGQGTWRTGGVGIFFWNWGVP